MTDDDDPKKKRREDRDESGEGDSGGPDRPKGVDFKSSRFLFIILVVGVIVAVFAGSKALPGRPDEIRQTDAVYWRYQTNASPVLVVPTMLPEASFTTVAEKAIVLTPYHCSSPLHFMLPFRSTLPEIPPE